jgi:predicted transcriptional regulator
MVRRAKPKILKSLIKGALGPLEDQVMRAVCATERSTVRDVVSALRGKFAYTTVMTTMDRLYQKGLLRRETSCKAYIYHPVMSTPQLETQVAHDLIAAFLACRQGPAGFMASALVDAVEAYNAALLEDVEKEILARRCNAIPGTQGILNVPQSYSAAYDWPLGNS